MRGLLTLIRIAQAAQDLLVRTQACGKTEIKEWLGQDNAFKHYSAKKKGLNLSPALVKKDRNCCRHQTRNKPNSMLVFAIHVHHRRFPGQLRLPSQMASRVLVTTLTLERHAQEGEKSVLCGLTLRSTIGGPPAIVPFRSAATLLAEKKKVPR